MNYSFQELKDFVNSQPDDKKVDMSDNNGIDTGCVLIQFAKNKNCQNISGCCYNTIYMKEGKRLAPDSESDSDSIAYIILNCINKQVKKYKEVKEIFREQN